MKVYIVTPQFLVTEELVQLASDAIDSFKKHDVFMISVDDTGEYEKAKGADEAMAKSDLVLSYPKNKGFGGACNTGFNWIFENEKDDCYIICANNDILVNKKTIKALTDPFNEYDNVGITGIISTDANDWEGKPLEEMDWHVVSEGGQCRDRMQDGGLWCSKKSILQKIGIFDPIFLRGGFEDVDLFLRARDTFGYKLIMSGRACYWHKQGATRWNTEKIGISNNFGIESKMIEDENFDRFVKKWGFNPHTKQLWFDRTI